MLPPSCFTAVPRLVHPERHRSSENGYRSQARSKAIRPEIAGLRAAEILAQRGEWSQQWMARRRARLEAGHSVAMS
jgi:hypothetical protein